MTIIINPYDDVVLFHFDSDKNVIVRECIEHDTYQKAVKKDKDLCPFEVAFSLLNWDAKPSPFDVIMPQTPLRPFRKPHRYLEKDTIKYGAIIACFENCKDEKTHKLLRYEKREALIALAVFLAEYCNRPLLGVCYTVNELAVCLKMSTRRVSDSIKALNQMGLVTLETRKKGSISLGSVVLLEKAFFKEFVEECDTDEAIEALRKTNINQKTGEACIPYTLDAYFKQLSEIETVKQQLIQLVRDSETHDRIKTIAYRLL